LSSIGSSIIDHPLINVNIFGHRRKRTRILNPASRLGMLSLRTWASSPDIGRFPVPKEQNRELERKLATADALRQSVIKLKAGVGAPRKEREEWYAIPPFIMTSIHVDFCTPGRRSRRGFKPRTGYARSPRASRMYFDILKVVPDESRICTYGKEDL
jgi:hypothetical protein